MVERPAKADRQRGGESRPAPAKFLVDWTIGSTTGWGVFGLQLALHSVRRGDRLPILLAPPELKTVSPLHRDLLAGLTAESERFRGLCERQAGQTLRVQMPAIRALGNGIRGGSSGPALAASRNVGMIFFEDTRLDEPALARAARFDRILAGSTWNAEVLRHSGVHHAHVCLQGIDPTLFHPAPRARWFGDRFVVFSGGKLEFRKGQDIVVAAFREFHRRHRDSVLMVAWHNFWPGTMTEIAAAGHVQGQPAVQPGGRLDVVPWLADNGVPRAAVVDLGVVPHSQVGQAVREADLAVFPNRAEGGTNLVAMECMACGVPTVLSANTGHLDLIEEENCWALREQAPVTSSAQFQGTDGWGESSVAELLEHMESAYRYRDEARRRGDLGSRTLHRLTWQRQIDALFRLLDDLF